VDAADLRPEDRFLTRRGRALAVRAVAAEETTSLVYNLVVAGLHTFAVGAAGVLVHNRDPNLTDKQNDEIEAIEKKYRDKINDAEAKGDQKKADDWRYKRNKEIREVKGLPKLKREEWDEMKDRIRENQERGGEDEDDALEKLGVQNNNHATDDKTGEDREIVTHTSKGEGVTVRPDGVTDSHWLDNKSKADEDGVVYNEKQQRAEKEGAQKEGKELGIIISSDDHTAVRPSAPLAEEADVILHRDTETGKWRVWDKDANDGEGGWSKAMPAKEAAKLVGGEPN
jgi:hypothetical protein